MKNLKNFMSSCPIQIIFDFLRSAWSALQFIPYNHRFPNRNEWCSIDRKHSIPLKFQSGLDRTGSTGADVQQIASRQLNLAGERAAVGHPWLQSENIKVNPRAALPFGNAEYGEHAGG